MNEEQMFKKYTQVVVAATQRGSTYVLVLSPVEVTALHGAVALSMKHPEVQKQLQYAQVLLTDIRRRLCTLMVKMGFTQEEVEWLDKREVG